MRSFSIRTLLIGSFGVLTLALIIGLAYSVFALIAMARDEDALTRQVVPVVSLSGEMGGNVTRRHLLLNMHVNSLDSAARLQLEQNIDEHSQSWLGLSEQFAVCR